MTIRSARTAACLLLSLFQSTEGRAADYVLDIGKKYSLCREYLQNLRKISTPLDERLSFELPDNPKLKNFNKPKWQSIDPKSRLDIIEKIYRGKLRDTPKERAMSPEQRTQYWDTVLPKVLEEIDTDIVRMQAARIDFNNDGTPEDAFRYGRRIPTVTEKSNQAIEPSEFISWEYWFTGPDIRVEEGGRIYMSHFNYNIFFYKGRTYFGAHDIYLFGKAPPSRYIVFDSKNTGIGGAALINVCHFRYEL